MQGKRILLIVGGGIAAYKALELVRLIRGAGASVRAILTKAGAEFVTPLSLSSLTGDKVYRELFDLTDEAEIMYKVGSENAMAPRSSANWPKILPTMRMVLCDIIASSIPAQAQNTQLQCAHHQENQ